MNHPPGEDYALLTEIQQSFVDIDPEFTSLICPEGRKTLFEQAGRSALYCLYVGYGSAVVENQQTPHLDPKIVTSNACAREISSVTMSERTLKWLLVSHFQVPSSITPVSQFDVCTSHGSTR
jgi:hypothetical protein